LGEIKPAVAKWGSWLVFIVHFLIRPPVHWCFQTYWLNQAHCCIPCDVCNGFACWNGVNCSISIIDGLILMKNGLCLILYWCFPQASWQSMLHSFHHNELQHWRSNDTFINW
jgi:hypothetical protein